MSQNCLYLSLGSQQQSIATVSHFSLVQEDFGVAHADDLLYTFRSDKFLKPVLNASIIQTDEDRKFLATWQKLISNFVKYADPTPVVNNNVGWLKWKKAQDSRAACVYLDINLEPEEKHRMFAERMEFWNRMVFQDLLEKYAISHEEDELLNEIDSAIASVEEERTDVQDNKDDRHGRKKGRGGMRNMRKRKRLAKKLKQIKCQ